ncbi:hypothetical protein L0Y34_01020 [Candidatus Parcubacteria bacterium]|nr:hypothetical protein [Candidatus Parcubacteria bacterium]
MKTPTDFRSFTKLISGLSYGETIRPSRDWMVLLSIAGMLVLASLAWNAWFFLNVLTSDFSTTGSAQETVNTRAIEEAKALFSERAGEESRYRNEYEFIDPSRDR